MSPIFGKTRVERRVSTSPDILKSGMGIIYEAQSVTGKTFRNRQLAARFLRLSFIFSATGCGRQGQRSRGVQNTER